MEGENEGDMEDEVVYTKPSLLGKLKAIASKVRVTASLFFYSKTVRLSVVLRNDSVCFFDFRETERSMNMCS